MKRTKNAPNTFCEIESLPFSQLNKRNTPSNQITEIEKQKATDKVILRQRTLLLHSKIGKCQHPRTLPIIEQGREVHGTFKINVK